MTHEAHEQPKSPILQKLEAHPDFYFLINDEAACLKDGQIIYSQYTDYFYQMGVVLRESLEPGSRHSVAWLEDVAKKLFNERQAADADAESGRAKMS